MNTQQGLYADKPRDADDSIEAEFRRDVAPLIDKMRKHFEAEDNALLAMLPREASQ